ncbi:MAG TPA: UrcA family protein [Sphingomicrobium sp.]|nr:UrcA family protein [Sphingomicrobium sp.]
MLLELFALAAAAAAETDRTIVVDGLPTVHLSLAGYDLGQDEDVRNIKKRIRSAANRVCIRGRGTSLYLERVACVRSAVTDGDQQLNKLLGRHHPGSPLAASISISFPGK